MRNVWPLDEWCDRALIVTEDPDRPVVLRLRPRQVRLTLDEATLLLRALREALADPVDLAA
jgi:hypothetical protein